jgi:putative Mn2+ efflux pump MntP
MDIISIIIIAVGLAMDCFAVAVSKGICVKKFNLGYTLKMALLFGLFQGGMPLVGYFAGISFAEIITRVDHWAAFVLLAFIGGKMIYEGITKKEIIECECEDGVTEDNFKKMFGMGTLISLAVATSIDALVTGLIFVPFPGYIVIAVVIIGLISFFLTIIGSYIGVRFGSRFKLNANIVGGIILFAIGSKILIEHLIAT